MLRRCWHPFCSAPASWPHCKARLTRQRQRAVEQGAGGAGPRHPGPLGHRASLRCLLLIIIAAQSEVHHCIAAALGWLLAHGWWWQRWQQRIVVLLGWLQLLLLLTCTCQRAQTRSNRSWWQLCLFERALCSRCSLRCLRTEATCIAIKLICGSQHLCKPAPESKPGCRRPACWPRRCCRSCSHGSRISPTCWSGRQLMLLRLGFLPLPLLPLPLLHLLLCPGPSTRLCCPCCPSVAVQDGLERSVHIVPLQCLLAQRLCRAPPVITQPAPASHYSTGRGAVSTTQQPGPLSKRQAKVHVHLPGCRSACKPPPALCSGASGLSRRQVAQGQVATCRMVRSRAFTCRKASAVGPPRAKKLAQALAPHQAHKAPPAVRGPDGMSAAVLARASAACSASSRSR